MSIYYNKTSQQLIGGSGVRDAENLKPMSTPNNSYSW